MCLIVFAWRQHAAFDLIVGANRDEFHARPAAAADYWADAPWVLAGRDLLGGGTWMGVTAAGRFAAVTNYRDPSRQRADARSRGELTAAYLRAEETPARYAEQAWTLRHAYNGFNLLLGDLDALWYVGSHGSGPRQLATGVYGLSNHMLDTPWPKVERSKARFERALAQADPEAEVFGLLGDKSPAADGELPDTGVGSSWERALSAPFIATHGYGTRASTFLARDGTHLRFVERQFDDAGMALAERRYETP